MGRIAKQAYLVWSYSAEARMWNCVFEGPEMPAMAHYEVLRARNQRGTAHVVRDLTWRPVNDAIAERLAKVADADLVEPRWRPEPITAHTPKLPPERRVRPIGPKSKAGREGAPPAERMGEIAAALEELGPMTSHELAKALGRQVSKVSAWLGKLERSGAVKGGPVKGRWIWTATATAAARKEVG